MTTSFFGIPWLVWTIGCVLFSVFYTYNWPRSRLPAGERSVRSFIIHWFHGLAWILVAAQFTIRGMGGPGALADALIVVALILYGVYVIFLSSTGSVIMRPKGK